MSKSDIYKNNEIFHPTKKSNKKPRRRRSSSASDSRTFDAPKTRRRSRNSGFRRFIHLYRRNRIQKLVWGFIWLFLLSLIIISGLWEFWLKDRTTEKILPPQEEAVKQQPKSTKKAMLEQPEKKIDTTNLL